MLHLHTPLQTHHTVWLKAMMPFHIASNLQIACMSTVQVLARDVAYDLIPFAQRRGLHARLAEALESTLPRAAAATIAFHYSKSCHSVEGSEWKRAVKAIQYWEMAAEEAMDGIDHGQVAQIPISLTMQGKECHCDTCLNLLAEVTKSFGIYACSWGLGIVPTDRFLLMT